MTETRDRSQLPPLFRRHTRRPRLTGALDEATAQAIVLNAPAGYGKTTLAQEWLQGRDQVAWYQATAASADLAAFSTGLADVVSPFVGGAGDRLRQRLRVGDPPERAVRPLAELMAEDLASWPEDGIIVLDDYHLVADSVAVEGFVDWLLTLVPVRVLVTTRRRPSWASARRFLYGEIVEIGPEQLAMTDEEASKVLSQRPGDAVRALVRQAQGWPALIGLAALSTSLELPEERVSDALFRYFAEEVLRAEPPEVQRFMLLASIPMTVNARIARTLLGVGECEWIIGRLKDRDLLHEASSSEFRLHPLLRDFLRRKLSSDDPIEYRRVSRCAVDDARQRHSWEEVLELIQESDDGERALLLAGEATESLLDAGRIEAVEKWISVCETEASNHPEIQLAKAEVLTWRGRLAEAAIIGERLVSSVALTDRLRSRAAYVTGRALHLISEDEKALRFHGLARTTAQDQVQLEDALWGCFITAGELERAEAADFLKDLEAIQNPSADARLRVAAGWIIAAQRRGSYAGLWPRIEPLINVAERSLDPMVCSSFLARAADLSVSRGHFETANELAVRAVSFCTELNLDFARSLCLLIRGNAEVGLRFFQRVRQTVAEIRASRFEDPYVDLGIKLILLKLALSEGRRVDPVGDLIPPVPDLQRSGQGEYWALLAMSAARHDQETALSYAERARHLSRALEPGYYSDFAELMVSRRAGDEDSDEPDAVLRRLLMNCSSDEALESFVLAYRADPSLLLLADRDPACSTVMRSTIRLGNDLDLARRTGLDLGDLDTDSPLSLLTRREEEVLALLARGMSNAEIADSLFISKSTTKVHVRHIFEKLEVKTRLQAVLRARELDPSDYAAGLETKAGTSES